MLPASVTPEQALSYAEHFGSLEDTETTAIMREHHDELDAWKLEWFCVEQPDENDIKGRIALLSETLHDINITNWSSTTIADENWLEVCYKAFAPFTIGSFYIYSSHHHGTVPSGKHGLQIDAATAFGSGEHGTTEGCLTALEELKSQSFTPSHILDMGTGSGILAIAAYKLWNVPTLAPDIDDEAVTVAHRHVLLNSIPEHAVECVQSESFMDENIQNHAPYPLIIANILAVTLKEMVRELTNTLASNGVVILSGILDTQADAVIAIYEKHGLSLERKYPVDEWVTLRMRKTA